MSDVTLDDIVSLCKRRGFIYQGSEIYGGLAGTWDYGPLGVQLKRNITNLWWKTFVEDRDDTYGVDTTILMNPKVWQASGHVDTFTDPLVECSNCHGRFREDKIDTSKCPTCGKTGTFGEARQFNMMFKTFVGPAYESGKVTRTGKPVDAAGNVVENSDAEKYDLMSYDPSAVAYLRPETAQGMFTNFKNIVDTFSPDLPFGVAQVGRAFRNEISPRDFIFRLRELEIMELEYFITKDGWEQHFEMWRAETLKWYETLGLDKDKLKEVEVSADDRAHYSDRTVDFYYDFPSLGFDEIGGLAYRTDFDLQNHIRHSGKKLEYRPKDGGEAFVPHVIEPTYGVDRNLMAVISNAYTEDEVNGEKRIFLQLPAHLAPIKVAVSPLLKNKPELVAKAREVYTMLKNQFGAVMWDDNGNIGKRYRRQDEIGTPYCVTIDFETLEGEQKDTVTVRNRDTTEQQRVHFDKLIALIEP